MSSGSAAIPLLKAAPEAAQVADRLAGGDWRGLELCLAPRHVAAARRWTPRSRSARGAGRRRVADRRAPGRWPSGAFVRVDRLDDEAAAGSRRPPVRGGRSARRC